MAASNPKAFAKLASLLRYVDVQRGKNLLVGKLARGAKENDRIGNRAAHSRGSFASGFLDVAAEFVAHRRQQLVGIFREPARLEPSK